MEKLLEEMEIMEKNKKNTVLKLKKEREKLGNFGVLKKIANYLLKK